MEARAGRSCSRSAGRTCRRVAVVVSTMVAVGCGADQATDEWAGGLYERDGVPVVENPEDGLWTPATAWQLEQDLRIGVADGDPDQQFSAVVDLAVDRSGRIYVLDRDAGELRVFSSEGEHLRTIGRRGRGPGELTSPSAVLLGPADTLLVPDTRNQRVQRLLTDGSEAGAIAISVNEGIPLGWASRPDGHYLQEVRTLPGTHTEEQILVLLRAGDGEIRDTVLRVPVGDAMVIRNGQPEMTMFAPEPFWAALTDGGVVSGRNSEYRLEVRDAESAVTRVVLRPYERRRFDEADRREFRARLQQSLQNGWPPPATDGMLQAMRYAEHYPVYASLFGGPAGTIWVRHAKTVASLSDSDLAAFDVRSFPASTYDVFDGSGRFLGVLETPDRFEPMHADDEHVYGVQRDELGVQHVVRLRVRR